MYWLPLPTVQACAEVEIYQEQGPIRVADAQNLVLWVLGEGANPRWCFLKASGPGARALRWCACAACAGGRSQPPPPAPSTAG